ncbi:MAG TPA: hypothetical protein VHY91_08930 [Pirellulales bacterium]|nr:hypothetical protein [Pirellulales bacterium]
MIRITIQEAQAKLSELIHRLPPGNDVLITENDQPVALLYIGPLVRQTRAASDNRDWWAAIEEVGKRQKLRGFVGEVSDIDRDDQGYDNRLSEIYKQTMPKN